MRIARSINLRGYPDTPLARRQLGLLGGVTGALLPGLGLGKPKTTKQNHPTQPPGNGGGSTPLPAAPNPVTTAPPGNGGSTPTGTPGGSGGGNGGGGNNGGGGGGSSGGGNTSSGSGGGGSSGGGSSSSSGGSGGSGSSGSGSSSGSGGSGNSGGGGTSSGGDNTGGGTGGGGNNGGGGGGSNAGGGGTSTGTQPRSAGAATSTGTQPRTSGTPSDNTPSTGGTIPNNGPESDSSHVGAVNVGSGSPGSVKGGFSGLTPGTHTSGDPSDSSTSSTVNKSSNGKTGPRGGPIAAAVILSLLFAIAVVVFILRRRSRTRRDQHARKWWVTRKRTSQSYGDNEALNSGRSTRRSSFATTHDHSKASFLANPAIPPPPPMAEIGRPIGTDPALVWDINADQNRFSIGSANSHNSQFLVVHHRESLQHETSSMGCTESFPFPKPPPADHAMNSKACEGPRTGSPRRGESDVASPTSARSTTPQLALSNPFADNNSFNDSASGNSLEIETVRSPFIPEMGDELEVDIGDSVRIVQIFDDGWAFVEKFPKGEQGLIPLNCLFYLGQNTLPGGKRMSSQASQGPNI